MCCTCLLPKNAHGQKDSITQVLILNCKENAWKDTFLLNFETVTMTHRYDSLSWQLPIGNFGGITTAFIPASRLYSGFETAVMGELYASDSSVFLYPYSPFSEIRYVLGTGGEQNLLLIHSRRLSHQMSVTATYHKINTEGFFKYQKSDNDRLLISAQGASKNKKYLVNGYILHRRIRRQENGGIVSDSAFKASGFGNTRLLEVNYSEASVQFTSLTGKIFQKLRLSNNLFLNHATEAGSRVRTHFDILPDTLFYSTAYLNQDTTFTRWHHTFVNQKIGIVYSTGNLKIEPGYEFEAGKYASGFLSTMYQNHAVGVNVAYRNKIFDVAAVPAYYISGYNQGDYHLDLKATYRVDSSRAILTADIYAGSHTRAFDHLKFSSNNFRWYSELSSQQMYRINTAMYLVKTKTRLILEFQQVHHPVYYGYNRLPVYNADVVKTGSVTVNQWIKYKSLHAQLEGKWQFTSSYLVIPLPSVMAGFRVWWKVALFKKKMQSLPGVEIFYFTPYYMQGYEPATGMMYNQSEFKTGGYPVVNIFFNARVSQAEFFLSATNVTAGLLPYSYYAAYRYPLSPFAIKLGIRWQFYN